MARIFGVRTSNNLEKYLGLPTMVGRCKRHSFVGIKERISRKLESWSVRFLPIGGKEVLTKISVIGSLDL